MDILKNLIITIAGSLNISQDLMIKLCLIIGGLTAIIIVSLISLFRANKRLKRAIEQIKAYEVKLKSSYQKQKMIEEKFLEIQNDYKNLEDSMQSAFTPTLSRNASETNSVLSIETEQLSADKFKEVVNSVIQVYEEQKQNDIFIPVTNFITGLMSHKVVNREDYAVELINKLTQKYPSAFRIEEIRGKTGKHIAIYKERITLQYNNATQK